METELSLNALRLLQMHITKLTCNNCIYFKRESSSWRRDSFSCTTRKNPHLKYQPLIIKALEEACALYDEGLSKSINTIKYYSKMNTSAKHDILELMKMSLLELQPVALQWKVDTLDMKKQEVIYAILDAQAIPKAV